MMASNYQDSMSRRTQLGKENTIRLLEGILLTSEVKGGVFYNDYLETDNPAVVRGVSRFVGLHQFSNHDTDSRVINWAEILSLTIDQDMSDWSLVSRFNRSVWTAEKQAADQNETDDSLAFRAHNGKKVTVVQSIYDYIGETRPSEVERPLDENMALIIQKLCKKLLPGARFLEARYATMIALVELQDKILYRMEDNRDTPVRVLEGRMACKDGLVEYARIESECERWKRNLVTFQEMKGPIGYEDSLKVMTAKGLEKDKGAADFNKLYVSFQDNRNSIRNLIWTYAKRPDWNANIALKDILDEIKNLTERLQSYRGEILESNQGNTHVEDEDDARDGDDNRTRRGAAHRQEGQNQREIKRFHIKFATFARELYSREIPFIERSEGALESFKGEIASMLTIYDKLFMKQDDDHDNELQMATVDEKQLHVYTYLQKWKIDVANRTSILKQNQQDEIQQNKTKKDEARQILAKPGMIPDLWGPAGYLGWIEGTQQTLKMTLGYVADPIIGSYVKATLKNPKDILDTAAMTGSGQIIDRVNGNYSRDRNMFFLVFEPIIDYPDPTNKDKALENCKRILNLLERVINQGLDQFIGEQHLTLCEGKSIMKDRKAAYIMSKGIAKEREGGTDLSCIQTHQAPEISIVGPRASTPNPHPTVEIGDQLPLGVGEKVNFAEKLEITIKKQNDEIKVNLGLMGMKTKIDTFTKFLKVEIGILGALINDDRVMEGMGATKKKNHHFHVNQISTSQSGLNNQNNRQGQDGPRFIRRKGRIFDKEKFKPCPAGCGQTHTEGSLKGCKKFKANPVDEKWEVIKKHKICKCCLKGPRDRTHRQIANCDGPKCSHCGLGHATMMCRQKPTEQAVIHQIVEDAIDDFDYDGYYADDGTENATVNQVQTSTDIIDVEESTWGSYEFDEDEEADINLIQIEECFEDVSDFQNYLIKTYPTPVPEEECPTILRDMQMKQVCDNLQVRWGPDIQESKKRLITILENDRRKAEIVLKGVKLDLNGDLKDIKSLGDEEVKKLALDMLDKYLKVVEISADKINMPVTNMSIHETAARPWGTNNNPTWDLMVNDEINVTPLNNNPPRIIPNKQPKKFIAVHQIQRVDDSPYAEENCTFEITDDENEDFMLNIPVKELGITRKTLRNGDQMDMKSTGAYLPPNENEDYLPLSNESTGIAQAIYKKILEFARRLYVWSEGTTKGTYFPAWVKIKDANHRVKDATIYRTPEGDLYARLIVCLDVGSEAAILDEEPAAAFTFTEELPAATVTLSTISGSETKKCNRQVVTFLGTDGLEYQSATLEVNKIGQDKPMNHAKVNKHSEIWQLSYEQKKHIMNTATHRNKKCHLLLGIKNQGVFDRAVYAEELGVIHPACMPNMMFRKSILSDQVVLTGQAGIDPALKNPILFVSKQEFALNYAKMSPNLRCQWIGTLVTERPLNEVLGTTTSERMEEEESGNVMLIEELQEYPNQLECEDITDTLMSYEEMETGSQEVTLIKEENKLDLIDLDVNMITCEDLYPIMNPMEVKMLKISCESALDNAGKSVLDKEVEKGAGMDITDYQFGPKMKQKKSTRIFELKDKERLKKLGSTLRSNKMNDEKISEDFKNMTPSEKYLDPTNDFVVFYLSAEPWNEDMSQEDGYRVLDENFQNWRESMGILGSNSTNDLPGKENIRGAFHMQCCNIQTCNEMARFLNSEKDVTNVVMCDECRRRVCNGCILANSHITIQDKIKYMKYWNSIKIVNHPSGLRVQSDYFYKHDPAQVFAPANTNFQQAKDNLDGNIKRMRKKPQVLKEFITQVEKKIELKTLTVMTQDEWDFVRTKPHHYSLSTMVTSMTSVSTSDRLINHTNTKVPNQATSLSHEQVCVENPLNDQLDVMQSFCLEEYPLCLDISKAYLRGLCPFETSCLRLFLWYENIENMTGLKCYRRTTWDFGDTPASGNLSIAQRKILAPLCLNKISEAVVLQSSFADNYADSFKCKDTWNEVVADITEAHKLVGMPLKPGYTTTKADTNVLQTAGLTKDDPTTMLLGAIWNLDRDSLKNINYYQLKLNPKGPATRLKELKPDDIAPEKMTRDLLTRLTAQSYDRLGRLSHPVVASLKILQSRTCEVMDLNETKKPIIDRDENLAKLIAQFVTYLIDFDNLIESPRASCPEGYDIWGAIYPGDGGLGGYAGCSYILSEETNRPMTMNDDERIITDELGILRLRQEDLDLLKEDDPADDTFSDRNAKMCEDFEKKFGRKVTYDDRTQIVLSKRQKKEIDTEWKLIGKNTKVTDVLISRLLMCKSKTSKRSIPGNEILSKPLCMDLMIANAKVFARRQLLRNKEMNLIANGDSVCAALLMNPKLQSKNILLRGAAINTMAKANQVLDILPKAKISFTWSPGVTNPADLSTKLLIDPVTQINSELFRNGPEFYKSKTEVLKNTYMVISKKNGVEWLGLPEEITKTKRNSELMKVLLAKRKADALDNEISIEKQAKVEKRELPLTINLIELETDEHEFRCNGCAGTMEPTDTCGVYLTTVDEAGLSQTKACQKILSPEKIPELKNKQRFETLKLNDNIRGIEANIIKFNDENRNCNLVFPEDLYVYKFANPIMNEDLYHTLITRYDSWVPTFNMVKNLLNACGNFKRKNMDLTGIKWEAEAWRALIMSSQYWYPITGMKMVNRVNVQGMWATNFNLATTDAVRLYGNKNAPLLNNKDPLVSKLIRYHHTPSMLVIGPNRTLHRPKNLTMGKVMCGKFAIFTNNLTKMVSECIGSCPPCLKMKMESYRVPLGLTYTKIDNTVTPFQEISVDPLMPIYSPAWIGSRKIVTLYPLLIKCLNTGNIDVSVMENNTTRSIIIKLLSLEARFGITIEKLNSDAGSNLIKDNLNPTMKYDPSKRLFDKMKEMNTSKPRSQWTNYSETSTRQVKSFLKKALDLNDNSALPTLQRDEWAYLFDVIAYELNSVPCVKDSKENFMSPADLLYVGRSVEVRFDEVTSHFSNIRKMQNALQQYYDLLKEEMKNVMRIQWERYCEKENPNTHKGKIEPKIGDVVMWSSDWNNNQFGIVSKIDGSKCILKQKHNKETVQSTANLIPLVTQSWEPKTAEQMNN